MKPGASPREHQKTAVYIALLLFCLVLILLQLWLFVAAFENLLAGRIAMVKPAAVSSLVILAINVWMLAGIYRMDRSS